MAQKNINLGTGELTGDGESLRSALVKIEENFTDVYTSAFSGDYNDLTNKPATDLTQVGVNLLPDVDDTRDIGSPNKNWNDVYATKLWVNNSFALQDQEVGGAGLKVSLLKSDGTTATLVANVEGYATTADVAAAVQALDDDLRVGTPGALDSLNELAQAINDDPNFYQTVTSALATKADASSVPNLTSINAIGSSTGNLSITADNYVIIDSDNDGQIEIGRNSGVGNVIIGNSANSTDVEFDGNVIFNSNTTGAGFTYNQPIGPSQSQFGFDADIIDFGDGKTIDMQNSTVLFSGSTISGGAVPSTSNGQSGDKQGYIAFDGSYIYYCTADYTDGVADIWKRVAWSADTW